jgi:hypothetical protein
MLNTLNSTHHGSASGSLDLVQRLAVALDKAHLDCGCRTQLDEALAIFEKHERLRDACVCLANARTQREKIEVALIFLNDLDDLTATEADRSVYFDLALLFDSIAEMAQEGAGSMRALVEVTEEGANAYASAIAEAEAAHRSGKGKSKKRPAA